METHHGGALTRFSICVLTQTQCTPPHTSTIPTIINISHTSNHARDQLALYVLFAFLHELLNHFVRPLAVTSLSALLNTASPTFVILSTTIFQTTSSVIAPIIGLVTLLPDPISFYHETSLALVLLPSSRLTSAHIATFVHA